MKKTIFLIFAMLFLFTACDKFLDIKPKGLIYPEFYADYDKLLNAGVLNTSISASIGYMTDDAFLPYDISSMPPSVKTIELSDLNLYTFSSVVFTQGQFDDSWESTYSRIYYYNVIIEDIMNVKDASEKDKQSLRAEALVGRAFDYLNLVNIYAKHYDKATAATDLGVPLRLDKDMDKKGLQRATVKEVYDFIISELKEAEAVINPKFKNPMRASLSACYGVFARTYLYMGDYQKALEYANKTLAIKSDLLDYNAYPSIDNNKAIGRLQIPDYQKNPENIYMKTTTMGIGMSEKVFGSQDLMNLYNAEDMRKRLFFTRELFATNYDYDLWAPFLYQNVGITVPEMLLISAECEARIGNKDKAMEQLNKLVAKRMNNFTPLVAKDNEEALSLTLKERRKELAFLGIARLVDLKRLNKDPRFAKSITHITDKGKFTLEPNSGKYVLPIPPNVKLFNPGMPDNDRN